MRQLQDFVGDVYYPDIHVYKKDFNAITFKNTDTAPAKKIIMSIHVFFSDSSDSIISVEAYGDTATIDASRLFLSKPDGIQITSIEVSVSVFAESIFSDGSTRHDSTYVLTNFVLTEGFSLPNRQHYSESQVYVPPQLVFEASEGEGVAPYAEFSSNYVVEINGKKYYPNETIKLQPDGKDCVSSFNARVLSNYNSWAPTKATWAYGVSSIWISDIDTMNSHSDFLVFVDEIFAKNDFDINFRPIQSQNMISFDQWYESQSLVGIILEPLVDRVGWYEIVALTAFTKRNPGVTDPYLEFNVFPVRHTRANDRRYLVKTNILFTDFAYSAGIYQTLNFSTDEGDTTVPIQAALSSITGSTFVPKVVAFAINSPTCTINQDDTISHPTFQDRMGNGVATENTYDYQFATTSGRLAQYSLSALCYGRFSESFSAIILESFGSDFFKKAFKVNDIILFAHGSTSNISTEVLFPDGGFIKRDLTSVPVGALWVILNTNMLDAEQLSIVYENQQTQRCSYTGYKSTSYTLQTPAVGLGVSFFTTYIYLINFAHYVTFFVVPRGDDILLTSSKFEVSNSIYMIQASITDPDVYNAILNRNSGENLTLEANITVNNGLELTDKIEIDFATTDLSLYRFPYNCTNSVMLLNTDDRYNQYMMDLSKVTVKKNSDNVLYLAPEIYYFSPMNVGRPPYANNGMIIENRPESDFFVIKNNANELDYNNRIRLYTDFSGDLDYVSYYERMKAGEAVEYWTNQPVTMGVIKQTQAGDNNVCIAEPCSKQTNSSQDFINGARSNYSLMLYSQCDSDKVFWLKYINMDGLIRWCPAIVKQKKYINNNPTLKQVYPSEFTINAFPVQAPVSLSEEIVVLISDIPKGMYIEDILYSPYIMGYSSDGQNYFYCAIKETEIVRDEDAETEDFVLTLIKKV